MEMDERLLRCSCGSGHFISVGRFPDEIELWFTVEDERGRRLWERVKSAWKVLRDQDHSSAEVILRPTQARLLVAELQRHLDAIAAMTTE